MKNIKNLRAAKNELREESLSYAYVAAKHGLSRTSLYEYYPAKERAKDATAKRDAPTRLHARYGDAPRIIAVTRTPAKMTREELVRFSIEETLIGFSANELESLLTKVVSIVKGRG